MWLGDNLGVVFVVSIDWRMRLEAPVMLARQQWANSCQSLRLCICCMQVQRCRYHVFRCTCTLYLEKWWKMSVCRFCVGGICNFDCRPFARRIAQLGVSNAQRDTGQGGPWSAAGWLLHSSWHPEPCDAGLVGWAFGEEKNEGGDCRKCKGYKCLWVWGNVCVHNVVHGFCFDSFILEGVRVNQIWYNRRLDKLSWSKAWVRQKSEPEGERISNQESTKSASYLATSQYFS